MRQRIALVTPGTFPVPSPKSSSVEQAVCELAGKLAAYADVEVFGPKTGRQRKKVRLGGVTFIRAAGKSRGDYARRVIQELRRGSYRVIQVENRPWLASLVKRRIPGTAVWLFLHSLTYVGSRRRRSMRGWLAKPDRIVVNSSYLKEELAKLYPELAPKVSVNHLGVNPEQFLPRWSEEARQDRERRLAELGLSGRRILLYVGRLIPLKGVHLLLEAMPGIAAAVPEAVLVIVGGAYYGSNKETAYVRQLKRLAQPLADRIRFVPFVPHDRIQEWFRLADISLVPTPRREAFGLVNVEAMATGVPVVACASGGIVEVVEHGATGFLLPAERFVDELPQVIASILNDDALQQCLGTNGIRRVEERFTWEQSAGRWWSLVEQYG